MRPLADIRIISLEQYGAGPFGSQHLADLGADVIKIEDPGAGGDVGRYIPPYAEGEDSLFFQSHNRNKRSVNLNIRTAEGREVFEDLVRNADAVYSNMRGDVPAKLKIRYDDLKHINPKIVCCSLSGFGMTGPRSTEPGYDYVMQGLAGWMSLTGDPSGPPTKSGLSLVDYSGGFVAALSLMSGIHTARRDGVGMDCDVSLYDTAISLLSYQATWHLTEGYEPARLARSAHPSLVPFQVFPASDGWIVIGCAKQKFWERFAKVLGREDLLRDPRFATFADRKEQRFELQDIIDAELSRRTVAEWLSLLRAASVPSGPINSVEEALQEEHTRARKMIISTQRAGEKEIRHVNSPVRVGAARTNHDPAPMRGEHTESVLREVLGYNDATLERLTTAHAFGKPINVDHIDENRALSTI